VARGRGPPPTIVPRRPAFAGDLTLAFPNRRGAARRARSEPGRARRAAGRRRYRL